MTTAHQNREKRFSFLINILIGFGGAAMVMETRLLVHQTPSFLMPLIIGLCTFGSYWFLRQPKVIHLPSALIKVSGLLILIAECMFGFGFFPFTFSSDKFIFTHEHLALLLPALLVTMVYSRHTLQPHTGRSLRDIPYIKVFIIAYCWSALTVLPAATINPVNDQLTGIGLLIVVSHRFLFVLALAILSDVIDLEKDRPLIKTFPTLFGKKGSLLVAMILALISDIILSQVEWQYQLLFPGMISTGFAASAILLFRERYAEIAVEFSFMIHATLIYFSL